MVEGVAHPLESRDYLEYGEVITDGIIYISGHLDPLEIACFLGKTCSPPSLFSRKNGDEI